MSGAEISILIKARDEASAVLNHVSKESGGLGSKLKALAPALAGVAAGFLSFKAAEGAIDATQELGLAVNKLRRETGMTAEESSQLLFAFKHIGLDGDDASRSIGILAKKLKGVQDEETGVTTGGKSTAAILADIGVTAVDLAGNLTPFQTLLPQIADKFKSMPDGIEKTGLAMQLFGRSGKDMIPLLNLGAEGMAELAKEADKLGVTLTAGNLEQIKAYTFAHRDMEEAITGVKLQIGLALMPVLTRFAQWFTEHQPEIRAFISEVLGELIRAFFGARDALEAARPQLEGIFNTLRDGFGVIRPGLQWIVDNKIVIAAALVAIGVAAVVAFTPITGPIAAIVAGLGAIVFAIGAVDKAWKDTSPDRKKNETDELTYWQGLHIVLANIGDTIKAVFNDPTLFNWLVSAKDGFWNFANATTNTLGGLFDWLREAVKNAIFVFEGFGPVLDKVQRDFWTVVHAVEALIEAIDRIPTPGDILGGIGSGVKGLLGFASGGVVPGGLALVGERGPELVMLPGGSRVFSNEDSREMAASTITHTYYIDRVELHGDPQAGLAALGVSL